MKGLFVFLLLTLSTFAFYMGYLSGARAASRPLLLQDVIIPPSQITQIDGDIVVPEAVTQ